MKFLPEFVRRLARDSVTQPLSSPVTSNAAMYLERVGEHKLGWRAFRREVVYRLSGQERYRIDRLCDGCTRGLWMYFGVPQIGDSLMDLAPRSLFAELGVKVDLITYPSLTELYRGDPWFSDVLADVSALREGTYDFVIVPSHKHRSLKMKRRHLPHLPWLSMHGRFTGPDFHRAEFAARRIADFLSLAPSAENFAWHARPKLGDAVAEDGDLPVPEFSSNAIALALGGVDVRRTYLHWPEVVRGLALAGFTDFVLLGSENGTGAAHAIIERGSPSSRIYNFVGRTSLSACRRLLSRCVLAIAADGGLMHLAVAGRVPVVSLFHEDEQPRSLWFLPASEVGLAIHSNTRDVSDIAPLQIVELARKVLLQKSVASELPPPPPTRSL